jgi:predicted nucleotidyltransferase
MSYSKDEAIAVIGAFLESIRQELPIERAYLFGSYATGRNGDYSDIDLAIVTPILNDENSLAINQKIFRRAMRYNLDLEPICFSLEEFEKEEQPIVLDIKRTGIAIKASGVNNSLVPALSRARGRSLKSHKASISRRTSKSMRKR